MLMEVAWPLIVIFTERVIQGLLAKIKEVKT